MDIYFQVEIAGKEKTDNQYFDYRFLAGDRPGSNRRPLEPQSSALTN